jgi:hypothetical protein
VSDVLFGARGEQSRAVLVELQVVCRCESIPVDGPFLLLDKLHGQGRGLRTGCEVGHGCGGARWSGRKSATTKTALLGGAGGATAGISHSKLS